ncbi:MAG: polyprenol monophosphomannose synthase [Phototrophicales bacterium]|nr:MAG: polyprenol monophosphomannose synthase [Phototrophicales bacterium]
MDLTVVLPTYNEAENLPRIVNALLELKLQDTTLSILVVDDNSPDGTGQIADELHAQYPERIQVLHRKNKEGLGRAYLDGFQVALDDGADAILQMDADFSHQPHYIPAMLAALKEADFVVGSRFTKGGSVDERWAWWRKLLSWFANSVYVRLILRTPIRDATGGFKLWRRETLIGMDIQNRIRSNGYIFQVEMNYVALRLGYKAVEIPIYFPDREFGESKMSFHIQYEAAARVFQVWWRHRKLTAADRAKT